jgi:hypothetical protein
MLWQQILAEGIVSQRSGVYLVGTWGVEALAAIV